MERLALAFGVYPALTESRRIGIMRELEIPDIFRGRFVSPFVSPGGEKTDDSGLPLIARMNLEVASQCGFADRRGPLTTPAKAAASP
jgi:hypothetical protein